MAEPPAYLSATELGKAMNVSKMAVSKYVAAGMPIAGMSERNTRLFDLAACQRWKADNYVPDGREAKRGGRKPKDAADPDPAGSEVAETIADAIIEGELSLDSADAILKNWATGKVVPAKARSLFDTVKAARERVKLDEEMGLLVRKDDVRTEFGEHLRSVRVNFESLPNIAQLRIRDILKLTDAQAALVRAELEKIVRSVLRGIAATPFDAP